jgi:hypothetical protein
MDGLNYLGVDEAVKAPAFKTFTAEDSQKERESRDAKTKVIRNIILIAAGGVLAAGTATAILWKAHRVLGFLLGGIFIGPVVGGAGAAVYATHAAKQLADGRVKK